jgi:hypothetical protein
MPLKVTLPKLTAGIEKPNDVAGLGVSATQVRALVHDGSSNTGCPGYPTRRAAWRQRVRCESWPQPPRYPGDDSIHTFDLLVMRINWRSKRLIRRPQSASGWPELWPGGSVRLVLMAFRVRKLALVAFPGKLIDAALRCGIET